MEKQCKDMNDRNYISVRLFEEYTLMASFFALGIGISSLYLPLFFIVFITELFRAKSINLRKSYLLLCILMGMSIVPLYTIGYGVITLDEPLLSMAPVLFTIFVAGCFFQACSKQKQKLLLTSYVTGLGLHAFAVTTYSFYLDSSLYGYGRLLDPFNGVISNSPAFSNNLALLASVFVYSIYKYNSSVRLLSYFALSICVFLGVFLEGRTFFIILFIAIIFCNFKKHEDNWPQTITILVTVVATIIISNLFLTSGAGFEPTLNRFKMGLDSPRFELYIDGLSKVFLHPYGGFEVSPSVFNTNWFHNIFLDNARLAGWIPVLSLLLAISYIFIVHLKQNELASYSFLLFIVSFLVMQQDVVIEGNYRVLMVMYLAGLLMLPHHTLTYFKLRNTMSFKSS